MSRRVACSTFWSGAAANILLNWLTFSARPGKQHAHHDENPRFYLRGYNDVGEYFTVTCSLISPERACGKT